MSGDGLVKLPGGQHRGRQSCEQVGPRPDPDLAVSLGCSSSAKGFEAPGCPRGTGGTTALGRVLFLLEGPSLPGAPGFVLVGQFQPIASEAPLLPRPREPLNLRSWSSYQHRVPSVSGSWDILFECCCAFTFWGQILSSILMS